MLRAFIFDMDGVLVDSEDISMQVGIAYFASIGVKAARDDFRSSLGKGERGFFDGAAAELGVKEPYSYDEASAFFRSRYPEMIKGVSIALPGAVSIVKKARECGILTAVASSAPAWKVRANIAAAGLSESDFNFIASGEDIIRNKPEKDIYELAMIKLGVGSSEAVIFEDSAAGIESGKRAGCRVVALMTTIDGESAAAAGADAVVTDLSVLSNFSSAEEAERMIEGVSSSEASGAVRYGANLVVPLSRKMPWSFTEKRAVEAARKAMENAYAPYSGFRVGAAVVSAATGRIYAGCNVENSSYGAAICAERNAITTAVANEGVFGLDLLVVFSEDDPPAPPCALCLQVAAEFARPESAVLLVSADGKTRRHTFSELLPMPFIFPTMR